VRLHPVVSIILGFLVFEIIYQIALEWFLLLIYVAMVLGAFIATYFAKKMRIEYGLYVGICIIMSLLLFTLYYGLNVSLGTGFIVMALIILSITGIGGLIGNKIR
jgi:uncharacterized membrane protein